MALADGLEPLLTDPDVLYLRGQQRLSLVVCGWSASGKSIFARNLATLIGCEYVCASTLLVSELGIQAVDWIEDREHIEALRRPDLERVVDDRLLALLETTPKIVLDSWVAPFLSTSHDAAIWIECSLDVRVRNAIGPSGKHNDESQLQIREGLVAKDLDSIRRFKDSYGFVFGPDPSIFPVSVDVTELVSPDETNWPRERRDVIGAIATHLARHLHLHRPVL